MPVQIIRNDITKMKVDAIVNAANSSLLGGGGVDGSIHRAAGPELLAECRKLGGCPTGSARITGAGKLPCRYVIHAVGPRWEGGTHGEPEKLASCYRTSLRLAREHGCETVAFPLISSGIYGYPKDQALRIAMDAISAFLAENDMLVYLVIFDRASYQIGSRLYADISAYIDDRYADMHTDRSRRSPAVPRSASARESKLRIPDFLRQASQEASAPDLQPPAPAAPDPQVHTKRSAHEPRPPAPAAALPRSLSDALSRLDESFSEMLLRKISEKGMTDSQCYRKANIDRRLFSKIRSDRLYRPSKPTVLAFAVALELPLSETEEMLKKAGFALSPSNRFDIIVEYFIRRGNYNVFEINEALFAFDQSLLGG